MAALMATPVLWGAMTAGQALAAGAAITGALGAVSSGQSQAGALKYNAALEEQRAVEVQQQADADAEQQRQKTRRELGDQAAAFGAAGVDVQGTPLEVMADQATQGELSRQLVLYKGNLQATSYRNQAALDRAQASSASSSGWLKGGLTLLGGMATAFAGPAAAAGGGGGTTLGSNAFATPAGYMGKGYSGGYGF